MAIWRILDMIMTEMMPADNIHFLPYLLLMYLSLGSTLYTAYRMLRRKDLSTSIILLCVPFVLFGTLAIVEPLMTSSLFADTTFLESSGMTAFLAGEKRVYIETLTLVLLYAVIAYAFIRTASKRIPGFSKAGSLLTFCGLETLLALGLLGAGVSSLMSAPPVISILPAYWVKLFLYALFTVAIKTFIMLFILLYTLLFGGKEEAAQDEFNFGLEKLKSMVRGKARLIVGGLGGLLLLYFFAAVLPLMEEVKDGSEKNGQLLWILVGMGLFLTALFLYNLLLLIFPGLHPQLRKLQKWGDPQEEADALYREYRIQPPLFQAKGLYITKHYLIEESRPPFRFYRLDRLTQMKPAPNGWKLCFNDGSRLFLETVRVSLKAVQELESLCEKKKARIS